MIKKCRLYSIALLFLTIQVHSQQITDSTAKSAPQDDITMSDAWSIGIGAGTLGAGIKINKTFGTKFSLSLGCYLFSYKYSAQTSIQKEQVSMNTDISSNTIPLLLAYYPFKNSINIKAGIAFSSHNTAVEIAPLQNYVYGNLTFTPDNIGAIRFDINRAIIQPYLGLGIGRDNPRKRLNMAFDLGFFYHGTPQIKLMATEALSPTANENNQSVLTNAFSQFVLYPFLNISFNIKIL